MTVAYRDREGRLMRYEKADGSVWDRVHVYRDAELNKSDGERPERIWVETKKGGKKVRAALTSHSPRIQTQSFVQ